MSVPDITTEFGKRVRALRAGLQISQEDLAERAGLDRTYIGGIERGERNPALRNIGKLAKSLGVSMSVLLEGVNAD